MLIKDEQQQKKDKFFYQVETDNQRINESLRQYDHAVLIGKGDDPTDIMQRMGKCLSPAELIKKLYKLSYYIAVERNPKNPKMYVLYSTRGGKKTYIGAFEDSLVPERTLMDTKTVEDVDPSTLDPAWTPGKYDAPLKDVHGIIQIDESQPRPGLIKYTIPWHITKMGYRTLLLRLMQQGIVSKTKIELEFGNDNTPEWASKTGNRSSIQARF
ncbi:hypothetical protein UFOVP434_46 [uncultured Caudovirales phage]|uniref:Uncharacterized protein n=1 Tax=uncultured Caudovirales phage TaxID=2100421 RepID=A0A6J5MC49_9CAUD|nr:hypothetical protein UFOVP434_46 [uncultured Caudovirales phage]